MEKRILFSKILEHLTLHQSAVLCAVISASGSSPRGAGAAMAVFENGTIAGSIGGGAVERHAAELAAEILKTGQSQQKAFCLRANEIADIGMVCGGSVRVQFARLEPDEQTKQMIQTLLDAISDAHAAWLVMKLDGQSVKSLAVYDKKKGLLFASDLSEADVLPYLAAKPVYTERLYTEPVSTDGSVYVFGGGHVGAALVPLLDGVGFSVTVYDDREELATKEHFPAAKQVIFGQYDQISEKIAIHPEDYVVILTPGHLGDRAVLLQAMRTKACYIGCIGSRSKIAATNAFLLENGILKSELSRIHAPIGLPIGAETPQEIAVSIAAELIAHRAKCRKEQENGI